MEVSLAHQGRTGVTPGDLEVLRPRFERLVRDSGSVSLLARDLVAELGTP
jgi:hypothetical protein